MDNINQPIRFFIELSLHRQYMQRIAPNMNFFRYLEEQRFPKPEYHLVLQALKFDMEHPYLRNLSKRDKAIILTLNNYPIRDIAKILDFSTSSIQKTKNSASKHTFHIASMLSFPLKPYAQQVMEDWQTFRNQCHAKGYHIL